MGAIERKICRVVVKEFDREGLGAVALLAASSLELARVRVDRGVASDACLGIGAVEHDGVVEGRLLPCFGDVALRACPTLVQSLVGVVGLVAVDAALAWQRQGEDLVALIGVLVARHARRHHVRARQREDGLGVPCQVEREGAQRASEWHDVQSVQRTSPAGAGCWST